MYVYVYTHTRIHTYTYTYVCIIPIQVNMLLSFGVRVGVTEKGSLHFGESNGSNISTRSAVIKVYLGSWIQPIVVSAVCVRLTCMRHECVQQCIMYMREW